MKYKEFFVEILNRLLSQLKVPPFLEQRRFNSNYQVLGAIISERNQISVVKSL